MGRERPVGLESNLLTSPRQRREPAAGARPVGRLPVARGRRAARCGHQLAAPGGQSESGRAPADRFASLRRGNGINSTSELAPVVRKH